MLAAHRSKYSPLSYTRSDTTASNPDKEGIVGGGLPPSAWVQRANSLKEAYEQRMQVSVYVVCVCVLGC